MTDLVPADQFTRLPERYQRRARQIAERVREIDALCRPADPMAVGEALKRMRLHFRPQPETEPREMASGFKDACRDLPAWAISEASNDFLAGRVPNHTGQFMPTCAEFAKRAREIITPFMAERSALRTEAGKLVERAEDEARRIAIDIERQDPAVQARVAQMIDQFSAGQPKAITMKHGVLTPDKQARLDTMKKRRPFQSKIGHQPGQSAE